jgi:hypothetical protein
MDWKDNRDKGPDQWNFIVGPIYIKDSDNGPGRFRFAKIQSKHYYNEGDKISSSKNYIPDLTFTGIPITVDHVPCGYWHDRPMAESTYILTTKLYPVEVEESAKIITTFILDGSHRRELTTYSMEYEAVDVDSGSVDSGILRSSLVHYTISGGDQAQILGDSVISGIIRQTVKSYLLPIEFFYIDGDAVLSGDLDKRLITYNNYIYESLTTNGDEVIGGTHAS